MRSGKIKEGFRDFMQECKLVSIYFIGHVACSLWNTPCTIFNELQNNRIVDKLCTYISTKACMGVFIDT